MAPAAAVKPFESEQVTFGIATNWINGEWVDSIQRTDSFDPATGQRIVSYADATHADVASTINAAVQAFQTTD